MTKRTQPQTLIDPRHPALSESRPLFIDNRDGNTLARALAHHVEALRRAQGLPWVLSIAASCFDLDGFNLLADELEHTAKVRLLLGAEPPADATWREPALDDPPEPEFTRRRVAEALHQLADGLRYRRDLLPFDADTDRAVARLLDCLTSGRIVTGTACPF
jgi:hypothetical protein